MLIRITKSLSVVAAGAFSLLYLSLYPVLRGEFVIHHYPPWPPAPTVIYILVGLSYRVLRGEPRMVFVQAAVGMLYVLALFALPGDIYQT